jgi:hypothetical protein
MVFDWSRFSKEPAVYLTCFMDKEEISAENKSSISTELATAVAEISKRIEHEYLLIALKFTAAGAIVGFIFNFLKSQPPQPAAHNSSPVHGEGFSHPEAMAVASWAAFAICAIIDIRIQANSHLISLLGQWIRENAEPCLMHQEFTGWEEFFSQKLHSNIFYPALLADRLVLTLFIYGLALRVFLFIRNVDEKEEYIRIARFAIPTCIVLFYLIGLYNYTNRPKLLLIYTASSVIMLALILISLPKSRI